MSDICERLKEAKEAWEIAYPKSTPLTELLQEAIAEIERLRSGWIRADTEPEESGWYLCWMMDGRDDYDETWHEVLYFKVRQAFHNSWDVADFDTVMFWMPLPQPPQEPK